MRFVGCGQLAGAAGAPCAPWCPRATAATGLQQPPRKRRCLHQLGSAETEFRNADLSITLGFAAVADFFSMYLLVHLSGLVCSQLLSCSEDAFLMVSHQP